MNGARPPTTFQSVQRSLALSFTLLLAALAALSVEGDRLFAPLLCELPALCRAEESPCPSCGLTRGVVAALDLDFEAARRFHPGALPLLALLGIQVLGRAALGSRRIGGWRAVLIGAGDFALHFALAGTLVNGRPDMP